MRALVLALLGTSLIQVQNTDVIGKRQEIYKSFGSETKTVGAMLKGEAPFDLALVRKTLATYSRGAKALPDLFPDDSKVGSKTQALPAIWENKADFDARLKKFGADSDAALATITDQASFMANFAGLAKQCGGCHKLYREKNA